MGKIIIKNFIAHNDRVFMSGFAFRKTCIKHIVNCWHGSISRNFNRRTKNILKF